MSISTIRRAMASMGRNNRDLRSSRRNRLARQQRQYGTSLESLEIRSMLTAGFGFDFTAIASDLSQDPQQRFYGSQDPDDSPLTVIRYGSGTLTSLTDFPTISAIVSDPSEITFEFGSLDVNNPVEVVTLSTFLPGNPQNSEFEPAEQTYTPDGNDDPSLTVFHNGSAVATGQLLEVNLETALNGTVTSPARDASIFRLTASAGNDSTIFDAIIGATGGTGDVPFTLSGFQLQGTWAGAADAEIFNSTGGTLLSVPEDDHGNTIGTATVWDTSSPIDGLFEVTGDEDVFQVALTAGNQYSFVLTPGTLPERAFFDLHNASDVLVAESDFDPAGVSSTRLTYTASTSGNFFIYAEPTSGPGSYTIALDSVVAISGDDHGNDQNSGTAWDRQSAVSGNIELPNDADWFEVQLTQGTEYTFRTNLMTLTDTVLTVYDAQGTMLAENDDAGNSTATLHSEIEFVAPTTGTFFLAVTGYAEFQQDSYVGSYSLEQIAEQIFVPDRPTLNPVTSPSENQRPDLTWDAIPNAVSYEVYIADVTSQHTAIVREFSNTNSFTPSVDVGIGTRRAWVRARSAAGVYSQWSAFQQFYVNTRATISAMDFHVDSTNPTISWEALPGAEAYEVWVNNRTLGMNEVLHPTDITDTSFTPAVDALSFGLHRVWVRGFDSRGVRARWSTPVDFYVGPQAVSPVTPTFDVRPTFEWSSVPDAAAYDFSVYQPGAGFTTITDIAGTSHTPMADLQATRTVWWIRPVSSGGTRGIWSAPIEINLAGRASILAPTGGTTSSRPTFSWTAVGTATSYELYVSQLGVGLAFRQSGLTSTSFTPSSDLAPGTYRAWIRAFDSMGLAGQWSVPVDFTVVSSSGSNHESDPEFDSLLTVLSAQTNTILEVSDDAEVAEDVKAVAYVAPPKATPRRDAMDNVSAFPAVDVAPSADALKEEDALSLLIEAVHEDRSLLEYL